MRIYVSPRPDWTSLSTTHLARVLGRSGVAVVELACDSLRHAMDEARRLMEPDGGRLLSLAVIARGKGVAPTWRILLPELDEAQRALLQPRPKRRRLRPRSKPLRAIQPPAPVEEIIAARLADGWRRGGHRQKVPIRPPAPIEEIIGARIASRQKAPTESRGYDPSRWPALFPRLPAEPLEDESYSICADLSDALRAELRAGLPDEEIPTWYRPLSAEDISWHTTRRGRRKKELERWDS